MYGDFVVQVDAVVGQVLDALKTTGIDQDTLVIFSSDNGPLWYDKDRERFRHDAAGGLRGKKFDSWEGGHRMPFLVRWPRRVAANHVCDQTVVFSDMLATFAELVGFQEIPRGMAEDSVSFLPYLLNAAKKPERRPPIIHDQRTVRDGNWKLILPKEGENTNANAAAELYNLQEDLCERTNQVSQHPEIAQRLEQHLSALIDVGQ